jgi:adenosine deaminase CECR1
MRLFLLLVLVSVTRLKAQPDFSAQFERLKAEATREQLYALLYDLPKGGDLHHHGTLAAYPEEWLAAATDPAVLKGNEFFTRLRFNACADSAEPFLRYHNIARFQWRRLSECAKAEYVSLTSLSTEQRSQWISALILDRDGEGRDEFFERVVLRVTALARDPNVLMEVIARYLQRYGREGLRYLETQSNPLGAVDAEGNAVSAEEYVRITKAMLDRPDVKATGITVRFLFSVIRFHPNSESLIERAYEFVHRYRDLWVGVNLVGREDNDKGHALRFLETFRKMRRKYAGVHLSIHGGEVDAPGREVRNTLLLGAERVGHAVNLITDPDTMLLMRNGRNLVEVSLVSNRLLEYVPSFAHHPFPEYLRFGIPVCLNTDDPGVWDSNLTDEYFIAGRNFDLAWEEVVRIGRASIEHSFTPAALKAELLRNYDSAVKAFESRYADAGWQSRLESVKPSISGYARRNLLARE